MWSLIQWGATILWGRSGCRRAACRSGCELSASYLRLCCAEITEQSIAFGSAQLKTYRHCRSNDGWYSIDNKRAELLLLRRISSCTLQHCRDTKRNDFSYITIYIHFNRNQNYTSYVGGCSDSRVWSIHTLDDVISCFFQADCRRLRLNMILNGLILRCFPTSVCGGGHGK
jgi:hypothetical protein